MKQFINKIIGYSSLSIFGLLALGQVGRIQVTPQIAMYLHDVLILVCLGWWIGQELSKKAPKIKHLLVIKYTWWLVLGIWIFLGAVLATILTGEIVHWLYLGRLIGYTLFTYVFFKKSSQVNPTLPSKLALYGFLASGLLVMFLGWLQYLIVPDTRFLSELGWDDHYYRLISTQFDPAYTGMILIMTFFLSNIVRFKYWRMGLKILIVLAISVTFSRATYLAFTTALLVWVGLNAQQRKYVWLELLFIPLVLIGIWLAPKPTGEGVNLSRTSTIVSRTTASAHFVNTMEPWQWVVGRGLLLPTDVGQPEQPSNMADHAQQPDNLLVTLMTGLGGIGVGLLCIGIWSVRNQVGDYPTWLLAIFVAVLIHSQFNNTLFQPFIFLMLAGIMWSSQSAGLQSKSDL